MSVLVGSQKDPSNMSEGHSVATEESPHPFSSHIYDMMWREVTHMEECLRVGKQTGHKNSKPGFNLKNTNCFFKTGFALFTTVGSVL